MRGLVALTLAVPLVATGVTAQAAACSGTGGVTVIVQFPDHTETGCAPGNPSSGLSALQGAGFSYAFHPRNPGFVCKINGSPGDGNCMKPNYWAYFHAQRGGSWVYSSEGASSYDPAPGSVQGWRFGSGSAPTTPPPPAAPKPEPAPKPTTKPSLTSSPAASASTSPSANRSAAADAAKTDAAKAKAKATAEAKKKKAVAKAKASASAAQTNPPSEVAAPLEKSGPDAEQGGGGNIPWLWGVVGLVVVGGAAGAVTLARRH